MKVNKEFENIATLIEDARNRAFQKVNEELVLLYFNVGNIVSVKVTAGVWGENTVGELASFIQLKFPGLSGFTRRGLYRMKQFYEVYGSLEFVSPIATQLETWFAGNKENVKVSAMPTQIQAAKARSKKMSAMPTQSKQLKVLQDKLASLLLCKVSWSNHLEILSQTKSPEEKLFYLLHCIKDKWSMRDLRRQLSSGYFERTMLSGAIPPTVQSSLPQNLLKTPTYLSFSIYRMAILKQTSKKHWF